MISEWARQASGPPHPKSPTTHLSSRIPQYNDITILSKESCVILAIEAIKKNQDLSIRAAATIYKCSRVTLARRLKGIQSRQDTMPNSRNLTSLEEDTIIQYILDLDARLHPPRLVSVEEMANRLLAERGAPPVGKRWASNFVKRRPELRTRFFRRYDYSRA